MRTVEDIYELFLGVDCKIYIGRALKEKEKEKDKDKDKTWGPHSWDF